MATDDGQGETPPAIVTLAAQVDEMRARVQRMHVDLHDGAGPGAGAESDGASDQRTAHQAAVKAMGAATLELLDAQSRLRAMRVAHRQQMVADLLERDRRRERQRLWQLTGGVALAGVLVVILAVAGAISTARLAIGVPVLIAAALMAVSMTAGVARDAGSHALDLRKAVIVAVLALIAFVGAVSWRPLGYACLLAIVIAAIPVVAAVRARRERAAESGGRRDRG
jgi:uncharacterized membrane protein YhaH (DUF805 family)